ncbi:MAG: hypothetical protein IPM98_15840 [Lewinellaceae bacterium]|nr:hypothetical protein [Lewinellaceae bacterium]
MRRFPAGAIERRTDDDTILYSAIYVSAHFIEPCSEVDISFPQAGWVVHPDTSAATDDNLLPITLTGYDRTDEDLDVVRLQYRATGGDGAWIAIGENRQPAKPRRQYCPGTRCAAVLRASTGTRWG